MCKELQKLADNRKNLLQAEIAAWLHMIGKYQKAFVEGKREFAHQVPDILKQLKDKRVEIISDNTLGDSTLEKFITKHNRTDNAKKDSNNEYSYIEKLLIDAHGRGSGTDKGVIKSYTQQGNINQDNEKVRYMSSAFGWEGDKVDVAKINNSIDIFYKFIKETMEKAWNDDLNVDGWVKLLDDFRQRIKIEFSQTFADSRYPINDVSLWDQTASTVAFFKTHLANSLFDTNRCNPLNEDNKKKFRVLQVIIGGMDYLGQSNRIADLIYRKEQINRGFDSVRNVIEIEYPLGFEIYRDLDRIAFLVPDQEKLKEMENCKGDSLEQIILDKFCGPQKENPAMVNEINVNKIVLSKIGTRNVFFIGEELQKDSSQTYLPGIEELKKIWQGKKSDRCIVCQMRPRGYTKENNNNGSRAYKRKICGICLERLNGRSKDWAEEKLSGNTIWMDEVADRNGRVALITAKLDLAEWQNGKMISTLKNISNKNNNKNENEYVKLTKELKQVDNDTILKNNVNLESLEDIIIPYIFKNKTKGKLYNLQVKEEDLGGNNNLNDNEKLALAVWRKTPSFARIHRIWETSRKFWNDIAEEFENSVRKRKSRIKIVVTLPEENKIKRYHSYIAEIENEIRFTVVALNNGFYITENLQWLSSKIGVDKDIVKSENDSVQFVLNYLKKYENIILYEFEQMNEKVGVLKINSIEKEKSNYLPSIRILEEPERFIAIVPAEKAFNVVKNINEKYSIEMGKVRNRLPLTLGLIFAPSHTPLSVLMNAGERVLKMPVKDEIWIVEEIKSYEDNEQDKYLIRIKKKKESEFKNNLDIEGKTEYEWYPQWEVNKNMGKDDKTEDQWYPFFCINKKDDTENRSKSYKGPDGYWLVHVSELEKNDEIVIKPSRFDFEFLDSSTRRYEISYSEKNGSVKRRIKGENSNYNKKDSEWKLLCEGKANRPYYLEQINEIFKLNEILEKHLSKSQIYQIIESIENKRNEWGKIESQKNIKEAFKNFVKITIKNAEWKCRPDIKDLDKIISAGINGLLKDTVEIYFKILKCNEEVGLNEK